MRAIGCFASESLFGGRISTISPFTSRQTMSAILWICLMLCETITIVNPHFVFSFTNTSSMFSVEIGSNALVGSSSNNTFTRAEIPSSILTHPLLNYIPKQSNKHKCHSNCIFSCSTTRILYLLKLSFINIFTESLAKCKRM